MGSITQCVAKTATEAGAKIYTDVTVSEIMTQGDRAVGVKLEDGTVIEAKVKTTTR